MIFTKNSRKQFLKQKETARALVHERLQYFNSLYQFTFHRVSIRNQRSRWGSCSQAGNLNFNYRIIFLPGDLVDYIIVHELCHLKEMNHSARFWHLVAQTIPDYAARRRYLKKIRIR
ncbi:MAG: M48 family metallopeptidase [Candidatus Kerfeldbacteria bacterium]|nr:M48 family metallopeptidase [Candidatus Kerfeldbacteria bacterium]